MAWTPDLLSSSEYLPWLLTVGIAASIFVLIIQWRADPLRKLPGPSALWPLGNFLELGRKGYHECQLEWLRKYGPIYRYYMGYRRIIVLCEPRLIQDMAVRQFSKFHDRPLPPYAAPESRRSLIFGKGAYWAGVRNALLPFFHSTRLRSFARPMHKATDMLVRKLCAVGQQQVDILAWLEAMTLDVIGEVAFGISNETQQQKAQAEFAQAYAANERASSQTRVSMIVTMVMPPLGRFLKLILESLSFTAEHADRKRLNFILGECQIRIQRHRDYSTSLQESDLLTYLSRAQVKGTGQYLSIYDIRSLVLSMLGAGSGTTAHTIACAIHLLAKNPEAEARLVAEIDSFYEHTRSTDPGEPASFLSGGTSEYRSPVPQESISGNEQSSHHSREGGSSMQDKFLPADCGSLLQRVDATPMNQSDQGMPVCRPTYEELALFPYTEMVVKETLRLFPPGALIARESSADAVLGELALERGAVLIVPVYALHRSESLYPEPEAFRPERFEPRSEEDKRRHPAAYIPFGLGPRMCMGHRFAMEEAKLVLVRLYHKFTFQLVPGVESLHLNAGLNLKPSEVPVTVLPRHG